MINKLVTESPCQKDNLEPCEIENLRNKEFRCGLPHCLTHNFSKKVCSEFPKSPEIFIFTEFEESHR